MTFQFRLADDLNYEPRTEIQPRTEGQVQLISGDPSIPSGVYSGVDISLIVHLPSSEVEVNRIASEISTLQQELQSIRSENNEGNDRSNEIRSLEERILEKQTEQQNVRSVTKELAEVQTLSISVHREKFPVRTLGSVYPRSFTRGPRTISGSMVWTVFHEHIFQELLERTRYRSTGVGDFDNFTWTTAISDQIPPLDITISFSNEYGNNSMMAILGVEFVNEGMVLSIEDLFVEGTAQWIARDIDLIRNITPRPTIQSMDIGTSPTGTRLLMDELRSRVNTRRNPFL